MSVLDLGGTLVQKQVKVRAELPEDQIRLVEERELLSGSLVRKRGIRDQLSEQVQNVRQGVDHLTKWQGGKLAAITALTLRVEGRRV